MQKLDVSEKIIDGRAQSVREQPVESSGCTRSFLLRARRKAAPSSQARRLCGVPLRLNGDTKVVSTAICAPWWSGRPSATTSSRRASACGSGNRSKSLTSTFVDTRAPASRRTLDDPAPLPARVRVGGEAKGGEGAARERGRGKTQERGKFCLFH